LGFFDPVMARVDAPKNPIGVVAIAFDLFGTLVPSFSRRRNGAVLDACADACGLARDALHRHWVDTYPARVTGEAGDFLTQLDALAASTGVSVNPGVRAACGERFAAFVESSLVASPATHAALDAVRGAGTALVLVSNANLDIARAWPACDLAAVFDATAFSCELGVAKPDPRIYRAALERIGATAAETLFVGDGSDDELAGAASAGLVPVLLDVDRSDAYDAERAHLDGWSGFRVATISDVLELAIG
jgi:putative hydrolase of the HAD superfamily